MCILSPVPTKWTHSEMTATYKSRKEASEWNPPCWHLDLGLLFILFVYLQPPQLWEVMSIVWATQTVASCSGSLNRLRHFLSMPSLSQCGLFDSDLITEFAFRPTQLPTFPLSIVFSVLCLDSSLPVQCLRPGKQTYAFFLNGLTFTFIKSVRCQVLHTLKRHGYFFPRPLVLQIDLLISALGSKLGPD